MKKNLFLIMLTLSIPSLLIASDESRNKQLDSFKASLYECQTDKVLPLLEDADLIEALDYRKSTPLMNASLYGCVEIVRALLDKNANVHHRNKEKSSAMIYAMKGGHFEIVKMLEAKGANVLDKSNRATSLMNAAESGNFRLVRWLVEEKNADVNEAIDYHWPITSAAITGHSATIEFLITHGASQDSIDKALWSAISYGHLDAVEALIDGNADINRQDPETGNTPIMLAAHSGWSYESQYAEIVRTLILAGADLRIKNKMGQTVLEVAAASHEKTIGYLKNALDKK